MPDVSSPRAVLLARDLFFTTKITGTAGLLGFPVQVLGSTEPAVVRIGEIQPALVVIDLAAGDLGAPEAIARYRAAAPDATLLAYGSHVEADALRQAREAGCDLVLPRSRFTAELPDLLRRYLEPAPPVG